MSASPIARQVPQNIPSKRIVIHNANELPTEYSSTPGGTLYSTTPGGTRIVYERAFLMNLRNSPISRTPPRNIPSIPVEILKGSPNVTGSAKTPAGKEAVVIEESPEQFEMDM